VSRRSELDALPITEESGFDHVLRNPARCMPVATREHRRALLRTDGARNVIPPTSERSGSTSPPSRSWPARTSVSGRHSTPQPRLRLQRRQPGSPVSPAIARSSGKSPA